MVTGVAVAKGSSACCVMFGLRKEHDVAANENEDAPRRGLTHWLSKKSCAAPSGFGSGAYSAKPLPPVADIAVDHLEGRDDGGLVGRDRSRNGRKRKCVLLCVAFPSVFG
jgi:hypothetical protein